jgi:protein SCO1
MSLFRRFQSSAVSASLAAMCVTAAFGQYGAAPRLGPVLDNTVPKEMEGVDIVERLDNRIPLDTVVIDEDGREVALRSFFDSGKPVVLTLNYYTCPMLCTLTLNGLVEALKKVDFSAGESFEWVNVSVNPDDSVELAKVKKQNYAIVYERPGVSKGIHFTCAKAENSRAIADAVGYGYKLDERSGEYVHASAVFLITPDGRVARYLYGVKFEPETLRMALMEASEGRIGSTLDRIIYWCHRYDPEAGSYALAAYRVMQLGGFLTVMVMAGGLFWLWRRDMLAARPIVASDLASDLASERFGTPLTTH